MPDNVNYGSQQFGGHSQVGNQAIGQGASINIGVNQQLGPQTVELLARLERQLDEYHADLPAGTGVAAEMLSEELNNDQPDPGVVRKTLAKLTELVKPVGPLATTVAEITTAVRDIAG